MGKNVRRPILALIISSACYLGSEFIFQNKSEKRMSDAKRVARLETAVNEVQRKPKQRVIWETITKNEDLFSGEAVRTSPLAEAQLTFENGTKIHLDPDSLIVLEQNENGISLDFLQGNLFVQGGAANDDMTLKTGNGDIKMNAADLSLSKAQNGNVSLEVHRGEAELNRGATKTALTKEKTTQLSDTGLSAIDRVDILSPLAGETVYLNLTKGEKLTLNWKPLSAGYQMQVEYGPTRQGMRRLDSVHALGSDGRITLPTKPGSWNVRLVASSVDPKLPLKISAVIPLKVEAKSPPALVEPRENFTVRKSEPTASTSFKWLSRHKFESQVIEIAGDPLFKNVKSRDALAGDTSQHSVALDDGVYYWRVTGFLRINGKADALASAKASFKVISNWQAKPPELKFPTAEQHLSFLDTQRAGVTLKWNSPDGADRYKINVQRKDKNEWKDTLNEVTETNSYHLVDLKPGIYQWKVATVDRQEKNPTFSNPATFIISEIPKVEWMESTPTSEYQFHSPAPSLKAQWKPNSSRQSSYRYRLAAEGRSIDSAPWASTKQNMFEATVAAEGAYVVQVEALDDSGKSIAQSDLKTFIVKRLPLLPAPAWSVNTPPVFKSDSKGNLNVSWQPVDGAQNYLMVLEDLEGKVVEQKEVSRGLASLKRLKPGAYQVHLRSIDGYKRPGDEGPKRKIEVPSTSDIRAPKFKAMKVK